MILPTHTGLVEIDTPSLYPIRISMGITISASFSIIFIGKISPAISAAFSFVTALGEFCSPASKTYSSVPPSLAAPW